MADDFWQKQTDLKDPNYWSDWQKRAKEASLGVNKMPFVFGGGDADYHTLNGMSPSDIFKLFYSGGAPGAASGGAQSGSGAFDPNTQALLASFGFGGLGGLGGLGFSGGGGGGGSPAPQQQQPQQQSSGGSFGGLGIAGPVSPMQFPTSLGMGGGGSAPAPQPQDTSGYTGGLGYRGY